MYVIAATVVCIAPFALMSVHATTEPVGNEEPAPWPSLRTADGSWNDAYLSQAGEFLEDRIAFRPEMITADSELKVRLFDVSSQDSVIAGTDGWLYYAATLDDYQHRNNVSGRMLFNEAHNVRLMQDYVESLGGTFVFTIAPNKNTLYGGHMPAQYQIQVGEQSDFERLIPYLAEEGVNYVDLVSLFRSQKETLYYARDSHWNEKGAVLVYDALLNAAGVEHVDYLDAGSEDDTDSSAREENEHNSAREENEHNSAREENEHNSAREENGYNSARKDIDATIPTVTHDYYGDLGRMLYPAGVEPEDQLHYLTNPGWSYTTDTASVEENYIETENAGGSGTLLMYRDSFGNSLLPYMAETYGHAAFSKVVPYDLAADVGNTEPDTVIVERVERHLPTLAQVAPLIPASEQDFVLEFEEPDKDETSDDAGDDAGGKDSNEITDNADGGENTDAVADEVNDGNINTLSVRNSSDGAYVILSGQVDPALATDHSRIFAQLTDDNSTVLYEAFCVSGQGTDYGYVLNIPAGYVEGEIRTIQIIVEDGDDYTLALEQ